MAYWDLLKTTWAGTSGTIEQRLAAINAMTVTGSIPAQFPVSGEVLFDGINWTEFAALAPADQALIMQACILAATKPLIGGNGTMLANLFGAKFPPISVTGSIATTVLTVTVGAGVKVGQMLFAVAGSPTIQSLGTGSGGVGTYNLSSAATVASGSIMLLPQTTANLTKMAMAQVQPWTQANGYETPLTYASIQNMLSTT